jgi:hypothetical protein
MPASSQLQYTQDIVCEHTKAAEYCKIAQNVDYLAIKLFLFT